jgi:glycosyltransferase involved in cell wall biosynthesis
MISGRKIAAIIPAYNEEKSIAKVLILTSKFADYPIVVDDGSNDLSGEISKKMGFVTLTHETNQGKGAALRTGILYARKNFSFDILVTLDADLQHDPNDIPKIVGPILDGNADIVIGVRPMNSRVMPRERIAGNKIFDAMSNNGNDVKVQDTQSGFRAYTSDALERIQFRENGMAIESQTFIDATALGLRIKEVSVYTTYEGVKAKRTRLNHFSQVFDYLISRTVANSPLLYLGIPGIGAILLGVLAGLRVVEIFINNHQQIAAGTALIAVTLIIIGAVLMATSLIIKLVGVQTSR